MKCLHVIAGMDPRLGGVCQAVRTMIGGLQQAGVDNELACLDGADAPYLKDLDYPVWALGPGKGPWCYAPRLFPWLMEQAHRFDAVIIHGLWLYNSYAVQKAARLLKRRAQQECVGENPAPKVFVMPHGMLDPYFQKAKSRRLKALRNWVYWKVMERRVVNEAAGVLFTCTEEQRLAALPFRPYRPKQEAVVGLGVEEPPGYSPGMRQAFLLRCPQAGDQPYLLFLGRIHPKKGVDLLIKAYAGMAHKMAGIKVKMVVPAGEKEVEEPFSCKEASLPRLIIAGPGMETAFGQGLQQLVNQSPRLQNLVFFPGMLTGEAKWGAFYGCEAFVLASHQENFGVAIVEALACSKPVLISKSINIWKEIQDGGGGFVEAATRAGTGALLNHWFQLTKMEKTRMGMAARATYEANYAMGSATDRLVKALSHG